MRQKQCGVALIIVIWIVALISGVAMAFARSQKVEAELARNQRLIAQTRALAEAGIQRAYYELESPSLDPNRWRADGAVLNWETDGAKIAIRALDESARIDINTANINLLKGIIKNAGVDEEEAGKIVEAILDWRDQDDLKRPNGAELEDYRAAGKKVVPSNADFVSVTELQNVIGITPDVFKAIEPFLTVNSRQVGVSIALAPREVLLAIPNITPENVDLFLASRRDALQQRLPVPPLPGAQGGFAASPSRALRIQAEVTTAEGFKYGREAILRPAQRKTDPVEILAWKDALSPMAGPLDEPPTPPNTDGAPK